MKRRILNVINLGQKGIFAGITISLLYMLASYGVIFNFFVFLYHIIFGTLVGFSIAAVTSFNEIIIKKFFVNWSKGILLLSIISNFVLSGLVFFVEICIFSEFVMGYYPSRQALIMSSIWTGVASSIMSIILGYIDEKEQKLKLEQENKKLAVIEERRRIARDLHDSISQILFGISLNINTMQFMLDNDISKAKEISMNLQDMVQDVQTEMRLMIYELRPMSDKGFIEAVENLLNLYRQRFGIEIVSEVVCDEDFISSLKQQALYRIIQEGLSNVIRHSGATKVSINIIAKNKKVHLSIGDNGKGFDKSKVPESGHFGICSIKERINEVGGVLNIETSSMGTTIFVVV